MLWRAGTLRSNATRFAEGDEALNFLEPERGVRFLARTVAELRVRGDFREVAHERPVLRRFDERAAGALVTRNGRDVPAFDERRR